MPLIGGKSERKLAVRPPSGVVRSPRFDTCRPHSPLPDLNHENSELPVSERSSRTRRPCLAALLCSSIFSSASQIRKRALKSACNPKARNAIMSRFTVRPVLFAASPGLLAAGQTVSAQAYPSGGDDDSKHWEKLLNAIGAKLD
jgi:hypothetical protein